MRPQSGLDDRCYSPEVHRKIVLAGTELKSFGGAAKILAELAEITISSRHVNRLTDAAGEKLRAEQLDRAARHAEGRLRVEVENLPDLAVVEFDGGRIQTRQPGHGPGTHEAKWTESKTALFMRMSSETHAEDPAPEPPPTLLDRHNVGRLAKEIAGAPALAESEASELGDAESGAAAAEESPRYEPPKRLLRTCLANVDKSDVFGQQMAAEAQRKGFFQANRQAFVADGMKCNWTIWQTHFPLFVPIVDFIHAVSYLFKAALAISTNDAGTPDEDVGWGLCAAWIRDVWQGRVNEVIAEWDDWLADQDPPPEDIAADIAADDPREIVRKSRGYLHNNAARMDYPSYRQAGLPLTSTLMESLIKEINARVKGSEKFWNDPRSANNILTIKAAALCDDRPVYTAA